MRKPEDYTDEQKTRDRTDGLADGVIPGTKHPNQTSDPVPTAPAYEEKA